MTLRGVDPACGSGSFLLGAYQKIHDYIYETAVQSSSPGDYLDVDELGRQRVKFSVKCSILMNCIHGVDIDHRAIRVAELSLYLKLLENEPEIGNKPMPWLPKLQHNLQCGNSLISVLKRMILHQVKQISGGHLKHVFMEKFLAIGRYNGWVVARKVVVLVARWPF